MTQDSSDSSRHKIPNNRHLGTSDKQSSQFESSQSLEHRQRLAAQKIAALKKSGQLRNSASAVPQKNSTSQTTSGNTQISTSDATRTESGQRVSSSATGALYAPDKSVVLGKLGNLASRVKKIGFLQSISKKVLVGTGILAALVMTMAIAFSGDSNTNPDSSTTKYTKGDAEDWKKNSDGQMTYVMQGDEIDWYFQVNAALRTSPKILFQKAAYGEVRIDKGINAESSTVTGWIMMRNFDDQCFAQSYSAQKDSSANDGYSVSSIGDYQTPVDCNETMIDERALKHAKSTYSDYEKTRKDEHAERASELAQQSRITQEQNQKQRAKEIKAASDDAKRKANADRVAEHNRKRKEDNRQAALKVSNRNFPRPIAGDPAFENVIAVMDWSKKDMRSKTIDYLGWIFPEVTYYSNASFYSRHHGHSGLETGITGKWKAVLQNDDNVSHITGQLGVQFVDAANGCYKETLQVKRPVKFLGQDRYDIVHEFMDTEKNLPYLPAGPFEIIGHNLNITRVDCSELTSDRGSLKKYRRAVKKPAKQLWTINAQDVANYFWRFSGLGNDMVPLAVYDSLANSTYDLDSVSRVNEFNADYVRDDNLESVYPTIKYRMPNGTCYTTNFRLDRKGLREAGPHGTLAFPEVTITHYTGTSGSYRGADINLQKSVDAAKTNCDPNDSSYPEKTSVYSGPIGTDLVKPWPRRR